MHGLGRTREPTTGSSFPKRPTLQRGEWALQVAVPPSAARKTSAQAPDPSRSLEEVGTMLSQADQDGVSPATFGWPIQPAFDSL